MTRPDSQPASVPDLEMNPLQNPLLTANMGRWAEVYFTTPPEQRVQAIAELIRQLEVENDAPAKVEVAAAIDDSGEADNLEAQRNKPPEESLDSPTFAPSEPCMVCTECGHENLAGQRFCGMCGARLQTTTGSDVQATEPAADAGSESYVVELNYATGSFLGLSHAYQDESQPEHPMPEAASEPGWSVPDGDLPGFARMQPSVAYRYRLYFGAALVILISTLVYMSWQGKRAFPASKLTSTGAAYTQPAPAPMQAPAVLPTEVPKDISATTKQKTSPPAANQNDGSAPAKNPTPASPEQDEFASQQTPALKSANTATGRENTAQPEEARSATPLSGAVADSGQQELATAQRYLTDGPARNSSEAALSLWKAVGKGNVAATVALSDLYLRGDGVAKNCDQARLLLDAAAGKGDKGAAVRLRNLPAFGCP